MSQLPEGGNQCSSELHVTFLRKQRAPGGAGEGMAKAVRTHTSLREVAVTVRNVTLEDTPTTIAYLKN